MTIPTVGPSTTGAAASGNCTLTSWTPAAGELLLLFVDMRKTGITPTAAGNGQTWTPLIDVLNAQGQHQMYAFYAVASSPTTGSIVVTAAGNPDPIVAAAVRISGQHATTPIAQSQKHQGPAVDNNDMKDTISTSAADALVVAWGGYRNRRMNALGAGETSIVDDVTDGGGGGGETTASMWYEGVASPGAVELGADNCLSGDTDWALILIEVAAAAAAGGLIDSDLTGNMQDLNGGMAA